MEQEADFFGWTFSFQRILSEIQIEKFTTHLKRFMAIELNSSNWVEFNCKSKNTQKPMLNNTTAFWRGRHIWNLIQTGKKRIALLRTLMGNDLYYLLMGWIHKNIDKCYSLLVNELQAFNRLSSLGCCQIGWAFKMFDTYLMFILQADSHGIGAWTNLSTEAQFLRVCHPIAPNERRTKKTTSLLAIVS